MGPKIKKKKKTKKMSHLAKIRKEIEKLEKLHEKENDIVETIGEIIDDHEEELLDINIPDRWEGTG